MVGLRASNLAKVGKIVKCSALLADHGWLFKNSSLQSISNSLSELSNDLMFLAGQRVTVDSRSHVLWTKLFPKRCSPLCLPCL